MADGLHALVPTRHAFAVEANPGTSFLAAAGFRVRLLVNHSSIFDALTAGALLLSAEPPMAVVLLVHDDVAFHGTDGQSLVRTLRRYLSLSYAGFVGAAGCRTLQPGLVWWRNRSSATSLAGMVHHGLELGSSERAFYGPPGRVVALDGLLLATTVRTLRDVVRFDVPAGLAPSWHFYDVSATLQAHVAGLHNVALPLGVYHASKGKTDIAWEDARAHLASRLRPILPISVDDRPLPRASSRIAILCTAGAAEADARVPGVSAALYDSLLSAGYEVLQWSNELRGGGSDRRGHTLHPFELLESAFAPAGTRSAANGPARSSRASAHAASVVGRLARLPADVTLLVAATDSLPITPPADVDFLVEAALAQPRTLAAPLGCRHGCNDTTPHAEQRVAETADPWVHARTTDATGGVSSELRLSALRNATPADVGLFMRMAVGASGASGAAVHPAGRGTHTGELLALAPPTRVARFARSGLLFGKVETFRYLHAALPPRVRDALMNELTRTGGVASASSAERVPFETLYSLLATHAGVHNEVVPLASLALASAGAHETAVGSCPCLAF